MLIRISLLETFSQSVARAMAMALVALDRNRYRVVDQCKSVHLILYGKGSSEDLDKDHHLDLVQKKYILDQKNNSFYTDLRKLLP